MTEPERKHQFLWLDLETTGLDPYQGRILEWAAVLAADDADGDMSPIAQYTGLIATHDDRGVPIGSDVAKEIDAFVLKMHTQNGLLEACRTDPARTTLGEAEAFLVDLVGGADVRGVVLAGASVHFDLAWLRVHMPAFARCLSHRVLDVSTLKACERAWVGPGAFLDIKRDEHRALPDVLASLAEAWEIRARRWVTP